MAMLTLCWYNLKAFAKEPRALFLILLGPLCILLLVAYGIAPRLESNAYLAPFAIAVVDEEDSFETRTLIHQVTNSPAMRDLVTVRVTGAQEAARLLGEDRVAAVVVIPDGFVWNMERGKNLPFEVVGNPRQPLQASLTSQMMQSGADLVTGAQSGVNTVLHFLREAEATPGEIDRWFGRAVTEFTLQSLGRNELFTTRTVSATGSLSALEYYAVSFCVAPTLLAGLSFLWNVREGELGLLRRCRSLGVGSLQVAGAQLLTVTLLQFIQLLVLGIPVLTALPGRFYGSLPWLLLMALGVAAANAGMLLLISVCAPSRRAANVAGLITVLVLPLLGGGFLPSAFLPEPLRSGGWLSPAYWGIHGLSLAAFSHTPSQAMTSLGVLAATALAALLLSAGVLKRIVR